MNATDGVKGVEELYGNVKTMQAQKNIDSTQAANLRMQLNLLISELARFIGMAPTSLYKDGTGEHAYKISQNIALAANIVVGSTSPLIVNDQMMKSMQTKILGVASQMPLNFQLQNTWNMLQYDLIAEFISIQASYLSLVPQYISQMMVYMNKKDMEIMANKMQTAISKLKDE